MPEHRNPRHSCLLDSLSILSESGGSEIPTAWCRIIETRGSTPQKAGAVMLVQQDGRQIGTIGGGCIEAEVKTRALMSMRNRTPEISTFALNGDYGWDDGLICGGRMKIAIEPVFDALQRRYFQEFLEFAKTRRGATEVIVDQGSSGPAFLLFDESRHPVTSLRLDDSVDVDSIANNIKPLDQRPRAYAVDSASYVPVFPRCRLIIVGCGHVGQAVADLTADLDFDIWAVDDRSEFASRERFPLAEKIVVGPIDHALPRLDVDGGCYCLIVTRGHKHDERALYHLVNRGARYVGMIGSRRKINLIFEDLLEKGVSADALASVHAPVGIDIGSQTVAEIAVSIAAELVAHRNNGGVVPGRPDMVRVVSNE